jgi:hypothetical protein
VTGTNGNYEFSERLGNEMLKKNFAPFSCSRKIRYIKAYQGPVEYCALQIIVEKIRGRTLTEFMEGLEK